MKTNKGFIGILIIVIAAVILLGGGFYAYQKSEQRTDVSATSTTSVSNDKADQTNVTVDSNPDINPAVQISSGIKGNVKISPTCPGPVTPEQNCEKGYTTTFVATDVNGKFVKNFSSDANGNFTVELAPGQYLITQANAKILPKMASVGTVTVKDSTYTTLDIFFDSGIR